MIGEVERERTRYDLPGSQYSAHMPFSLVAGNEYLEDEIGWTQHDAWKTNSQVEDYMSYVDLYEKLIWNGIMSGRVTNTLDDIGSVKRWLKKEKWDLDISELSCEEKDLVVLLKSEIKPCSWSNAFVPTREVLESWERTQVKKKTCYVPDLKAKKLIIRGATTFKDHLGHSGGYYQVEVGVSGGKEMVTVRITDLTSSSNTFDEVLLSHKQEDMLDDDQAHQGVAFMEFDLQLTSAAMRSLQGSTCGDYQVTAIAGDGLQVHDQTSLNYQMKSLAKITYRGIAFDDKNMDGILDMCHTDEHGTYYTHMVELLIDDKIICAGLIDETCVYRN